MGTDRSARSEARWAARYARGGYVAPTEADWLTRWAERPQLYDDLYAVVFGGATLIRITAQRRADAAREAEHRQAHG